MRLIFRSMRRYSWRISGAILLKFIAGIAELLLPYILEHNIDVIVPRGELLPVVLWGSLMVGTAAVCCVLNVLANRLACDNAHLVTYDVRQELFEKTTHLSGTQTDRFGLPSLTSRMTSDSYNIQSFVQAFQTICVRAPFMLIGGILLTLTLDPVLAGILCAMIPPLFLVVLTVSFRGIPLFDRVQQTLDSIVRIMRENITGIRVIKALTKTEYEKERFARANEDMTRQNIRAGRLMAVPGPLMQICLNIGLVLVVVVGARRVDAGLARPGVILAFLTYFNIILFSVQALTRIFMMVSKASASARRIDEVLQTQDDQPVLSPEEVSAPSGPEFIRFEHVNFRYTGRDASPADSASSPGSATQPGAPAEDHTPALTLEDISFSLERGKSLGIIGPTGCGKSTILHLLLRFYDAQEGGVYLDGRDVRTYEKDELRRRFGVVFQNDTVFRQTLRENIAFGRCLTDERLAEAAGDAMFGEFLEAQPEGLDFTADIKGANLSGGQKQRLLISRALAGRPEVLVLDDSSSALDYRTDAALRASLHRSYTDSTLLMVAQRVSSVQGLSQILVMDEGRIIGAGTHDELMRTCPYYRETCEAQMGALA